MVSSVRRGRIMSCLGLVILFMPLGLAQDESIEPATLPSSWHTVATVYGALGRYSTDTDARAASAYITVSNAWRDYYTLGYATLWLERGDSGGKYYSQHALSARGSWFVSDRISVASHYAYLDEGEIQFYSNPATFHWGGAGASYWFSPFQVVGTSFTLSLSKGSVLARIYRAVHSFDVANGIWLTSSVIVTDAAWTPQLFSFRQLVTLPLGNESYLVAAGDFGRRGFYFDDEGLVIYNHRLVQTAGATLKGIVRIIPTFFVIPAVEYSRFDEYNVFYGSFGIRAVF